MVSKSTLDVQTKMSNGFGPVQLASPGSMQQPLSVRSTWLESARPIPEMPALAFYRPVTFLCPSNTWEQKTDAGNDNSRDSTKEQ
jgi:hypothetical protein